MNYDSTDVGSRRPARAISSTRTTGAANWPSRSPVSTRPAAPRHWVLIDYLRDEYFNNNQSTPNTRAILKAMGERWGEKIDQKTLYDLFPLDPSKQGGRIAGLPESKRKGGY
jgi:hypothetical protein